MVLVLLSAHIEIFSVSHMRDLKTTTKSEFLDILVLVLLSAHLEWSPVCDIFTVDCWEPVTL